MALTFDRTRSTKRDRGIAMLEAAVVSLGLLMLVLGGIFLFDRINVERELEYLTDRQAFDLRQPFFSSTATGLSFDEASFQARVGAIAEELRTQLGEIASRAGSAGAFYFDIRRIVIDVDPDSGQLSIGNEIVVDLGGSLSLSVEEDMRESFAERVQSTLSTSPTSAQIPSVNFGLSGGTERFIPRALAVGVRVFVEAQPSFVGSLFGEQSRSVSSDMMIQIIGGVK